MTVKEPKSFLYKLKSVLFKKRNPWIMVYNEEIRKMNREARNIQEKLLEKPEDDQTLPIKNVKIR